MNYHRLDKAQRERLAGRSIKAAVEFGHALWCVLHDVRIVGYPSDKDFEQRKEATRLHYGIRKQ